MLKTQGSERWRELLGVGGSSVRWGCAVAFLASVMVVWWQVGILREVVPWPTRQPVFMLGTLSWLIVPTATSALLWTVCIVAGFRLFRQWSAMALAPLAYTFLVLTYEYLRGFGYGKGAELVWMGAYSALLHYCGMGLTLLGILLALRWIKSPWVALAVGWWAGSLPLLAVSALGKRLFLSRTSVQYTTLDFQQAATTVSMDLFEAVLWAGLFYAGREIALAVKGRVSKRFYLASVVGTLQVGAAGLMVIPVLQGSESGRTVLGAASVVLMMYCAVVFLVWLHKMWAATQDGYARTTPNRAVGFLFIPGFNFYWAFQALWGFAKDYNRYLERHALPGPNLRAGVFLAYVILSFAGAIPFVGILAVEVNSILAAVMITQSCDAVNALPAEPETSLAA